MGRYAERRSRAGAGRDLNPVAGKEQARPADRCARVTPPRRRTRTPVVLVLALLAGLIAMHGLSGTALPGPTGQVMLVADMSAVMSADMAGGPAAHGAPPAVPVPDGPHHGSAAGGQHPCLAAPADGVALDTPNGTAAAALPQPQHAAGYAPARSRPDRAPPDLNELCVSRT